MLSKRTLWVHLSKYIDSHFSKIFLKVCISFPLGEDTCHWVNSQKLASTTFLIE